MNPLDDETLASRVFFPRKSAGRAPAGARDLMIPVARAELGARFYEKDPAFRTVLYFHGNGETVPDYDRIAGLYHRSRLNLFVVDYRGYGFSTGSRPTLRSLSEDPPIVSEFFLKQIRPAAPLPRAARPRRLRRREGRVLALPRHVHLQRPGHLPRRA